MQEREREGERRLEVRSLVAGEVSAGQLKRKAPKDRERESDVSSARAEMDDRAFSRFSRVLSVENPECARGISAIGRISPND